MKKEWKDDKGVYHIETTETLVSDRIKLTLCGAFAGFTVSNILYPAFVTSAVSAFCVGYLTYIGTSHLSASYKGLITIAEEKLHQIKEMFR